MPLTKEQLLQPRYRVIADYPFSPYKNGDIIEPKDGYWIASRVQSFEAFELRTVEHSFEERELTKYTNLFERARWSDNRLREDFPEYVLYDKTCVPAKVLSVKCDEAGFVTEVETDAEPEEYYRAAIWDFPATKEEYEAYIQSKQQS